MILRSSSTPGTIVPFQSRRELSHQRPGKISATRIARLLMSTPIARRLALNRQTGNRIGSASYQSVQDPLGLGLVSQPESWKREPFPELAEDDAEFSPDSPQRM
jgi:hypothetical protein